MDPAAKEVINYREATYRGYTIIKKKDLLSVSDIVKIQEIIIENNAGIRRLPGTSLVNNMMAMGGPEDY
jgi:Fic family protein